MLVKSAMLTDFVAKRRSNLYFLHQPDLASCKIGLNLGSKTRNISNKLVLQQCCKTTLISQFLMPVLSYLYRYVGHFEFVFTTNIVP